MTLYESAKQSEKDVIDAFELQAVQNVENLEATITDLNGQLAGVQDELLIAQSELAEANQENASLVHSIEQLNVVIVQLNETIAELEARIEELENPTPPDPAVLPYWGAPAWRDEFDGATIDPAKWNVRASSGDLGILDQSEVKREQCSIVDGRLRIRGQWKPGPNYTVAGSPRGTITHDTGYIDHRKVGGGHIFSQRYGRWEIRAKVPTGPNTRATLPAFWIRDNIAPGEIDIMEAWGQGGTMSSSYNTYTANTATTTIHSSTTGGSVNGKPYRKTFWRWFQHGIPRDIPTGFHTFAFEYTPTYMALIVDGVERVRVTPTSADAVNGGTLAWLWDTDFFGNPKHLRLNLHIGPEQTTDKMVDVAHPEYTADPLDYEIEYVRIWAMPS